ncbi:uncharacterized protein LOC112691066 [Sipha flava]|uniref:Uncharacterized protein LOC112691066 n=2 Tax=Sipha flava TaxID=143950 RepID=A0A8B8GDF8_9HEMI|nr:uncharacterized protein LOC112691066 [Sipha flava]
MTTFLLLIIALVLINTVHCINSIKRKKNNLSSEDHSLVSKNNRYILPEIPVYTTSISILENMEYKIIDNVFKNSNGRVIFPTNNLENVEYSIFKSNNKIGLESPQIKSLPVLNAIETRREENFDLELEPRPHDIENCSKNLTFCEKIQNYPRKKILKLLTNEKNLMFSILIDKHSATNYNISSLNNMNLKNMCFSKEFVIYPEVALNHNGKWRYIVQDGNSNFKQGISIIQCRKVGMSCPFTKLLPNNIKTCCVQEYINIKLVTVDTSKNIYYEKFKLPCCCKCKYIDS